MQSAMQRYKTHILESLLGRKDPINNVHEAWTWPENAFSWSLSLAVNLLDCTVYFGIVCFSLKSTFCYSIDTDSWLLIDCPSRESVSLLFLLILMSFWLGVWMKMESSIHGWERISSTDGRSDGRMLRHFRMRSWTSESIKRMFSLIICELWNKFIQEILFWKIPRYKIWIYGTHMIF